MQPIIGLGFEVLGLGGPELVEGSRISLGFDVLGPWSLELVWGPRIWALEANIWSGVCGFGPWKLRVGLGSKVLQLGRP